MTVSATLPGRREEDWRWADLAHAHALIDVPAPANDAASGSAAALPEHWLELEGVRNLFVAGQGEGKPNPIARASAHPLADIAADRAVAGTTITLADGEDGGTVQILHLATSGSAHGVTRVTLGKGASMTVIEHFFDTGEDHWLNHRFDAELADGAVLNRVVRIGNNHGLVTERCWAELGSDACFRQILMVSGEGVARSEAHVDLVGAKAHAHVNGALLGEGQAKLDVLTRLNHNVADTSSEQIFRVVAADRADLSIAGGVNVARNAQRTDGNQSLKGLVLKRTASCNLKPELEIFADDVKCNHGATVGELDKQALFYLESRGVPEEEAVALLTEAFVADVFQGIPQLLAELLEEQGRTWLERRT